MEEKRTFHLSMESADRFQPHPSPGAELDVRQVEQPCPEFNWFLHQAVGAAFRWGGREDWGEQRWTEYVDRDELETWVGYIAGAPAGYFELERQDDGSVRIECFGLTGRFIGKGLGGPFLNRAIERAWQMGATRVWLNTCSHDHPHALKNYLARGFELVKENTSQPNTPRDSVIFTSRLR